MRECGFQAKLKINLKTVFREKNILNEILKNNLCHFFLKNYVRPCQEFLGVIRKFFSTKCWRNKDKLRKAFLSAPKLKQYVTYTLCEK